jgi:2-amino-4-hydroxy-6-hydroxymethyldihydropteridine diphosphokinase
MHYYLGLGSNCGKRLKLLSRARRALRGAGLLILKTSPLYETEPVGFTDQPWFLNQVIEVETEMSPWKLLQTVQAIEKALGRGTGRRNGPRPIDIDILLAEETILRTPALEVPHPRLAERRFVLIPLNDIAPRAVHPLFRKNIGTLLRQCGDPAVVLKFR